jgi:hypothetical protein
MARTIFSEQTLVPLLDATFKEALEAEVEKAADEAAEKARAAVKKRLGSLVMSLFHEYSVFRQGSDLIVKVKINDGQDSPDEQR